LKAKFSPASNKLISVSISYDTGIVISQLNQFKANEVGNEVGNEEVDAAAAAQVAACEADAILDSLQMPHIEPSAVPSNVTVQGGSFSDPASITDVEKDSSSDESNDDTEVATKGMTTRRVLRRKD
jgi:hypothetical protein